MYRITPYRNMKRNVDLFDMFDDFFGSSKVYNGTMKVDVRDLDKEYIVDIDVPGLTKEDLSIHFENERLIVTINKEEEKEQEEDKYIHKERYVMNSKRSIYLKDVDPTKFKAKLVNGVLTINAEKLEEKISKYMIDIE